MPASVIAKLNKISLLDSELQSFNSFCERLHPAEGQVLTLLPQLKATLKSCNEAARFQTPVSAELCQALAKHVTHYNALNSLLPTVRSPLFLLACPEDLPRNPAIKAFIKQQVGHRIQQLSVQSNSAAKTRFCDHLQQWLGFVNCAELAKALKQHKAKMRLQALIVKLQAVAEQPATRAATDSLDREIQTLSTCIREELVNDEDKQTLFSAIEQRLKTLDLFYRYYLNGRKKRALTALDAKQYANLEAASTLLNGKHDSYQKHLKQAHEQFTQHEHLGGLSGQHDIGKLHNVIRLLLTFAPLPLKLRVVIGLLQRFKELSSYATAMQAQAFKQFLAAFAKDLGAAANIPPQHAIYKKLLIDFLRLLTKVRDKDGVKFNEVECSLQYAMDGLSKSELNACLQGLAKTQSDDFVRTLNERIAAEINDDATYAYGH